MAAMTFNLDFSFLRGLDVSDNAMRAPSDVTMEGQLLDRAQAGDVSAFWNLVEPCQRSVYVAALGILRDESSAEEVAQEAFLKAFKNVGSFRRQCKFSTWIIQIAINEARMKVRKDRRWLYDSVEEMMAGGAQEDGPSREIADWREIPLEALEQKELREALQKAIFGLPRIYREVFVLRDVQQISITETAKLLKITEGAVKTRLLRARLQLRKSLADYETSK